MAAIAVGNDKLLYAENILFEKMPKADSHVYLYEDKRPNQQRIA
jgi:hypothetical protein